MKSHKEGLSYKPGLARENPTTNTKNSSIIRDRNPVRLPHNLLIYKYHHIDFCTSLGHKSARSRECCTNRLAAAEKDVVFAKILKEIVDKELVKVLSKCKYVYIYFSTRQIFV